MFLYSDMSSVSFDVRSISLDSSRHFFRLVKIAFDFESSSVKLKLRQIWPHHFNNSEKLNKSPPIRFNSQQSDT